MPRGFTDQERATIQSALLSHGRALMEAHGLRKISVEELTAAAGISKGAFYLFFASKEELFFEVLQQYEAEVRARLLATIDAEGATGPARFRAMLHEVLALWQAKKKAVLFITHDLDEAIAMSDRVVILSAGPASHPIGEFHIDLDRPRDVAEIRNTPRFVELHQAIWGQLRDEVGAGAQARDVLVGGRVDGGDDVGAPGRGGVADRRARSLEGGVAEAGAGAGARLDDDLVPELRELCDRLRRRGDEPLPRTCLLGNTDEHQRLLVWVRRTTHRSGTAGGPGRRCPGPDGHGPASWSASHGMTDLGPSLSDVGPTRATRRAVGRPRRPRTLVTDFT